MKNTQKPINTWGKIRPYQGTEREQQIRVEKQAFVASIAAIGGFAGSILGFGMILGIVGLVLGIKAKHSNGKRPVGAVAAIIFGILSIILGIPGCIVIYGTYINPGSPFVQNLVNSIMGTQNMILF